MDEHHHDAIARWERRWLALSGLLTLLFVMLIAYSLATDGAHIAQRSGRTTPEQLTAQGPFQRPGLTVTGAKTFQLFIVAQAFSFTPAEVRLPVGAEVTFFLTSRDVLHGYQVENTTINVELIPGEISTLRYTFDRPGEYRVSCNEYCGISHQNMLGRIVVVPASQVARAGAAGDRDASVDIDVGAAVYNANCAACHQANGAGLPGVFPPLAAHAPALLATDGGRDYLVAVMLYGLQGDIRVDGQPYNGVMPAWAGLSDDEIAGVLNYVLTSWGNDAALPADAAPYRAEEIAAARATAQSAADVYAIRQTLGLE